MISLYFQHPTVLLLLWLLPGIAALLVYAQKRRMAAARRFVDPPMIARLMPELRGPRPRIKGTLLLLGLALLIVAAARPQHGVTLEKVKQHHGVDCFVLLDVSRSMLAEDVAPNRLDRAKSDIRDLLKKLGGDRVGLIVFAGKPVLKAPLTTDAGFFNIVLDDIDTRSAPRGGTLIGDAIRKALDSLPPAGDYDQILVLLTDGEDQDSFPLEAAKEAATRGVKIFTVGLGDSAEGARIPVRDASGRLEYVKDEGKEHWSKTDQSVLQKIASATGGAHVSAGTRTYDLGQVYEDRLAELARGEGQQDKDQQRRKDQYQIYLALALVLLAVERLLPACSRVMRPNAVRPLAMLLLACVVVASSMGAAPAQAASGSPARSVAQGVEAFRGGDFKTAGETFDAAADVMPNEPRIAFDRGCAYAAQGEHDKAVEQFQTVAASQNRPLAAMAQYNLGCVSIARAKAALGEKPEEAKPEARKEGLALLEQAAGQLRDCLAIEPEHADARFNIEALQVWKKHVQEVWRQRDLQKRRQEMSLTQFLDWLEKQQRELRAKNAPLASERPSPRRREAIRDAEYAQRELADEIGPLKEKLQAALTPPAPQGAPGQASPPAPKAPSPEAQQALALLNKLADEARDSMNRGADALAAQEPMQAVKPQAEAVEKIDNIFMFASPFVDLAKKGIAAEEGLIAQSKGECQETNGDKTAKDKNPPKDATPQDSSTDWHEAAWNQRFITNYGRVLAAKAKRELEQLAKTPEVAPAAKSAPTKPGDKTAAKPGQPDEQAKAEEQRKEMKRALQAGIDLSPKVVKLSSEAAAHLDASHPKAALPLQEETLKLLKEMLPKDKNKNDQNKNDQDQQNKDQQKKDQDKKDQNKKDQDKKKQDQKQQDKKDEKDKKDKDQKNQQQDQQDQQTQPEKSKQDKQKKAQDPSKQQAEAALQKVRERQQDRREKQRILLERLHRPERVDKDW
jgi:Ca-activated chloride channel homolog